MAVESVSSGAIDISNCLLDCHCGIGFNHLDDPVEDALYVRGVVADGCNPNSCDVPEVLIPDFSNGDMEIAASTILDGPKYLPLVFQGEAAIQPQVQFKGADDHCF